MSDLSGRLRGAAAGLSDNLGGSVTAAESVHLMRMAADALESYEAAERERLEHEAVTSEQPYYPGHDGEAIENPDYPASTIDLPWPLIPMPQDYPTMFEYTAAMVEWGKRVFEVEGAKP